MSETVAMRDIVLTTCLVVVGSAALFSACFLCQVKAKSGGRTTTTVAAQRAKMGR